MSNPQHTPGPWRACKDGRCSCGYIFGDNGEVYVAQAIHESNVDQMGCPDPHPTRECGDANLRLIAAAPDMLAALIRLVKYDDGGVARDYTEGLQAARAAIAKAGTLSIG